jgi:serine protease Do
MPDIARGSGGKQHISCGDFAYLKREHAHASHGFLVMKWAHHAFVIVLVLLAGSVALRTANADDEPGQIAAVVAKVSPAVVRITSVRPAKPEPAKPEDSQSDPKTVSASVPGLTTTAFGSGFVIDPSGFIATNKHVVEGSTMIFVLTDDGVRHEASVVGMPGTVDMALLHIEAGHQLPSVTFGDSDKMRVGDTVIAIGSPFGFDTTVTSGIVSAINRDIMESPFDDYIQTDAAINHGNSGGPLFNLQGEVIGMNSVIFSPSAGSSGLGFALPSNELRFVFGRLMKTGHVGAGMLPIHTQPVTWMLQQALDTPDLQGAMVTSVHDAGAKMLEGKIKPGDVIRTFNGEKVSDPRGLARKAALSPIGSDAVLEIFRAGATQTVHVTIHRWPESEPITLGSGVQRALGLELASGQGEQGQPIVTVTSVDPTGTAADSGIQKGDIIIEVQQTPVSEPDQALHLFTLQSAMKRHFAAVLVEHDKKFSWMPLAMPE